MITPEVKFCVRYLLEHGVNSKNFTTVALVLKPTDTRFQFTKIGATTSFFEELAERLRELWPPGEKDGKWPWRDSVSNLSIRLRSLWTSRNLKDYTIDECLTVARRYLAQFEDNAKYMMTLKYFIMKQDKLVGKDGRINYINKSVFADMLESVSSTDDEWNTIFESTSTTEQGELI